MIVGDPQFVGFRDQCFQVHGIDGSVYSLVSEPTLQVNALFVFRSSGHCPAASSGRAASNCWTHPGSYIGTVAVQHRSDTNGSAHTVLVQAGPADTGLHSVQVHGAEWSGSGEQLQQVAAGGVLVDRLSAYEVRISTPHFVFELVDSDNFLNQPVRPLVSLSQLQPHGLLGQTCQLQRRRVEGGVEEYAQDGDDMFGHSSPFVRFERVAANDSATEA